MDIFEEDTDGGTEEELCSIEEDIHGEESEPYLKQTKTIKNQNKKVDNDNNETLDKMKADFIEGYSTCDDFEGTI